MADIRSTALLGAAAFVLLTAAGCGERERQSQTAEVNATQTAAPAQSASEMLLAMADEHAEAVLRQAPEWATFLGADEAVAGEGYNGRLGRYGFEANQESRQLNERFLQDIRGIERSSLDTQSAITYDVFLDTASPPATLVCSDTGTASCDPGGLDFCTRYFWQVVARNARGQTTAGPVWSFTTESYSADLDKDCDVDFDDFAIFTSQWLLGVE